MKVRIHWNLNKGGVVIRNLPNQVGDMKYADSVCLKNVRFVVSAAGRDRVRKVGQRAVHAWLEGELCDCGEHTGDAIYYNPYTCNGFINADSRAIVTEARHVSIRTIGQGKKARPDTRAHN